MTRVTPQNIVNDSQLDETASEGASSSVVLAKGKRRTGILGCLLSFRLFLVLLIMSLVIMTAVAIWIASYVSSQQAAIQSTQTLIDNINQKVTYYIDGYLNMIKSVSFSLADDYHRYAVSPDISLYPYYYNRLKRTSATLLNLCFGEQGVNGMVGLDNLGRWGYQNFTQPHMRLFKSDMINGMVDMNTDTVLLNIPYVVNQTDYYQESLRVLENFPQGGFGAPYSVIGSSVQSMFYSAPVYDRTLYPAQKVRIGLSKINMSLGAISQFLANVKILTRGYIIVSEYDTNLLIGSSLNVTGVTTQRIPLTSILDRNAGDLMLDYLALNPTEGSLEILSQNGTTYLISTSSYSVDNLKWRMTIVFDQAEIMESVNMSSYEIIGVTLGVMFIGLIVSVAIGWGITYPLTVIQDDFNKIEVMQLSDIDSHSSMFTEIKHIYMGLSETVNWLREFRAFLPENILNQLEAAKDEVIIPNDPPSKTSMQRESIDKMANEKGSESQSAQSQMFQSARQPAQSSKHSSSMKASEKVSVDMFKIGLNPRECCVMYIKISNLSEK